MADRRQTPNTPQPDGRRITDQVAYASIEQTTGLTRRQLYRQTYDALLQERSSFEPTWQEQADYLAPRRIRRSTSDRNRGDRRTSLIYDSEPRFALRTLQHGMHAGITSPARPWFRLTTPTPDLAEQPEIKAWLHEVTTRMQTVFLRSNLYNALPILYGDLGCFGTAAMAVLEDDQDLMRCYSYPLMSYVFGIDSRGVACTFAREYTMTVRQLLSQYGGPDGHPLQRNQEIDWSHFSEVVRSAYLTGHLEQPIDVVWFVGPNDEYNPRALRASLAMPWKSCWFEKSTDDAAFAGRTPFLRESGYRVFPVVCPRWDVVGEDIYGTDGPGWVALPDVKQLQFQSKKKAKAIDKAIDPPLKAPSNLRNQKVSLIAGDVTYVDERDGGKSLAPVHEVRLEGIREMIQDMGETRLRIDRAFFADLFLMLANSDYGVRGGQPVTAREIEERHEEKLLALGPVLERLNDEALDPLIDRTFDIMLAAGAIPPPPEALQGQALRVEYVSVMAQAQKLVGVVGLDRFVASALSMAEVFPEAVHKVDAMQIIDSYGDKLGVDPKIVRSDAEAQKRADAAAQAAQQAHQAELLKTAGQGAQALGNTPTQDGTSTALDDVGAALGVQ